MAHTYRFIVEIEAEHVSGKFAARDEISEQLIEYIEGAEESEVSGIGVDGDTTYRINSWSVEET